MKEDLQSCISGMLNFMNVKSLDNAGIIYDQKNNQWTGFERLSKSELFKVYSEVYSEYSKYLMIHG